MRPKPRSLPPGHSFPGRSSRPAAVRLSPGPRFQAPVSPALLSLPGPQLPFPQVLPEPQVLSLPEPRLLYLRGKQSLTRCMCQNSIKCVPVTVHLHRHTYTISILIPYVLTPLSRAGLPGDSVLDLLGRGRRRGKRLRLKCQSPVRRSRLFSVDRKGQGLSLGIAST